MQKTTDKIYYKYGLANTYNRTVFTGFDTLKEARAEARKERENGNPCFVVRLNEYSGDIIRVMV